MTHDDITRMAREAGATPYTNRHYPDRPTHTFNIEQLERFSKLVRDDYSNKHANLWLDRCHAFMQAEREACAKVVGEFAQKWWSIHCASNKHMETTRKAHDDFCALQSAIRARGQA